jgi:hypothetical protein
VVPEAASVVDKSSTAATSANAASIAQVTGEEEEEAAAAAGKQSEKGDRFELKSRRQLAPHWTKKSGEEEDEQSWWRVPFGS